MCVCFSVAWETFGNICFKAVTPELATASNLIVNRLSNQSDAFLLFFFPKKQPIIVGTKHRRELATRVYFILIQHCLVFIHCVCIIVMYIIITSES